MKIEDKGITIIDHRHKPAKGKKEYCEFCGKEKIVSKKGNFYCPDICWKKPEYEQYKLDCQLAMESWVGDDWGCRD